MAQDVPDTSLVPTLLDMIDPDGGRVDLPLKAMNFVYSNSVHPPEGPFTNNVLDLMRWLINTVEYGHDKPAMTCGTRTAVVRILLEKAGIYTRGVRMHWDRLDYLSSTILMEVYDPTAKGWRLYDNENNHAYTHDAVWLFKHPEHFLDYGGMIMWDKSGIKSGFNVAIVDHSVFDMTKTFIGSREYPDDNDTAEGIITARYGYTLFRAGACIDIMELWI